MYGASGFFELASEISSTPIDSAQETGEDEIPHLLRRLINFFTADSCTILKEIGSEDRREILYAVEERKAASGCSSLDVQELVQHLSSDLLHNKKNMCLRIPQDLSVAPEFYHTSFMHPNIDSLLIVPISTGTSGNYLCALASYQSGQSWSKTQAAQFHIFSGMLVSAICRKGLLKTLSRTTRNLSEVQRIYRLGSWEWEAESGTIVEMEAVEHVLGTKPDTQSDFMERVHPEDRIRLQKTIEKAFSKEAEEPWIEYRMRTRRGDIRIIGSRFEVIRLGSKSHVIGTFHDLTALRHSEEELHMLRSRHWHTDRVTCSGILSPSLAHELSQPLTAILANAQASLMFLSNEPHEFKKTRDALKDIVADTKRATSIIDALRAMIWRKDSSRANVDVVDLVQDVLKLLLHSELLAHQVDVQLTCDSQRCFVFADKTQIEQVLLNLILNSIESMRGQLEERCLRIDVHLVDQDEIEVSVQDSGAGIPENQLGKVFEEFWTTKAHGLGIGLQICQSIIQAHGGRIWAECNADRGANFLFRLPAAGKATGFTNSPMAK